MKRGFSLIELIFAIVIIGICIAAIPKIVNASLESDEIGYKQEYFYEIKELYGLIRNLPLDIPNITYDKYKTNSLLAHHVVFCNDKVYDFNHYEIDELKLVNVNSRFGNIKGKRRKEYMPIGYKPATIQKSFYIVKKPFKPFQKYEAINVLGQKLTYNFGSNSAVDKSYAIKVVPISRITHPSSSSSFLSLPPDVSPHNYYYEDNNLCLAIARADTGTPCGGSMKSAIMVEDSSGNTVVSFDVYFHSLGRLDSIYTQYPMMTRESTWQTTNESKLSEYLK